MGCSLGRARSTRVGASLRDLIGEGERRDQGEETRGRRRSWEPPEAMQSTGRSFRRRQTPARSGRRSRAWEAAKRRKIGIAGVGELI